MLLCALDSRCNLELYQQNLRDWYFNRKYTGENIEFDIDQVTQKAIMKNFRGVSSDSNSGNRSLMGCCVLAFSPLSKEEIFPFIKITHNSRYSFKYTWFFIEFIRCLLEYEDKGQALQQAEQRCDVEVNRQNLCNGSFVVDTVESVVNWFMAKLQTSSTRHISKNSRPSRIRSARFWRTRSGSSGLRQSRQTRKMYSSSAAASIMPSVWKAVSR